MDLGTGGQSHLAEINVELLGAEERDVSSIDIRNRWRELVGEIPGVSSLTFIAEWIDMGNPVEVELSHRDYAVLLPASERLGERLFCVPIHPAMPDADNEYICAALLECVERLR